MTKLSIPSPGLAADYRRDGYLVRAEAFSPAEVIALRTEALALCRGDRGPIDGLLPAADDDSDEDIIRRYACVHFPHKRSDSTTTTTRPARSRQLVDGVLAPLHLRGGEAVCDGGAVGAGSNACGVALVRRSAPAGPERTRSADLT